MSATRAACLTPPGKGAIATVAVRGPQAWEIVRPLFQSRKPLPEQPEPGSFFLGRFGTDLTDEVVLAIRQWQPVPWLELHGHGGPAVTGLLLELLAERGAGVVGWQEFITWSEAGSLAAAALVALAQAPTARVAAILLDQWHGAFESALDAIRAAFDHQDWETARRLLAELNRHAPLGRHLTEPWRVVVLGPPNVGKSSLINAIAGYQRSVVSAQPGTTRDVVTTRLAVAGWPIELSDTAGLRDEADTLEAAGIALARQQAERADLCLYLVDGSQPLPAGLPESTTRLKRVVNKIDLGGDCALGPRVSAQTGQGVPELCAQIAHWLVPEPPPPGTAVPFTAALADAVQSAHECCAQGRHEQARSMMGETMNLVSGHGAKKLL